jgi:hypothetical protein
MFMVVSRQTWRRWAIFVMLLAFAVVVYTGVKPPTNIGEQGQDDEVQSVLAPVDLPIVAVSGSKEVSADEYRLERERVRSKQVEILNQTIADQTVEAERRDAAASALLRQLDLEAKEVELEHVLELWGYAGAVVALDTDRARVLVEEVLSPAEAARIGELVAHTTGVRRDQIAIVDGATH